jgi:CelD/BcsL family acetyltransferase involved in cellulose biosynthesis
MVVEQDFQPSGPARDLQGLPDLPALEGAAGWFLPSFPVEGRMPRLALVDGKIRYVAKQYKRFFVDLSMDAETYLKKFSSKTRATLRRKVRKFGELSGGTIDRREYRSPQELATFHDLARQLSQKTYQERLLDAGLPESEGFKRQMIAAAERGEVRAYLLFCEEKPVAYLYTPVRNGVFDYAYLGYDPELARWSPGTVLQWLVLESLFAEGGHRLFDFSGGQGAHKQLFSTGSQDCADVYFFSRTPRNLVLVPAHGGLDAASDLLAAGLDRLGLKKRIKKFIRSAGAG